MTFAAMDMKAAMTAFGATSVFGEIAITARPMPLFRSFSHQVRPISLIGARRPSCWMAI
jgi:hypothetical protein